MSRDDDVEVEAGGCGCLVVIAVVIGLWFLFHGDPSIVTLLHQLVVRWLQGQLA